MSASIVQKEGEDYQSPISDLLVELRSFPAHSALEDVQFHISFHIDAPEETTIVNDDWFPLATSFKMETFPFLKSVGADVAVYSGNLKKIATFFVAFPLIIWTSISTLHLLLISGSHGIEWLLPYVPYITCT